MKIINVKGESMVEIHELKNGIKVIFEAGSHYNSAAFGVWIKVGSRYESKENNGISHVIEHMLFKGTKTRTANDISRETAFLGGSLNAYTSKEDTSFYARTLPEYLNQAIDLISDMICNSIIDEEELEREKSVICEEIDMYKDSPEDYVHECIQKKVWDNQPLGYYISGKKKTVRGFTREYILEFIKEHYSGENMVISVAGKFDKQETLKIIEEKFGSIRKKGKKMKLATPEYIPARFIKKKDIEQLHMNIAFKGPSVRDDDRYAFTVMNVIMGGDVNSRLFQEIREKRGLTYTVYSYKSAFYDTGLWQIYAAMNQEQSGNVFELIRECINSLRKNGVTAEELNEAKHQLVVEMTLNRDNIMTKMNGNAKSYMDHGEILPFKTTIDRIKKVTQEDIFGVIEKYVVPEEMSCGLVGNVEKTFNMW